jgi:hypothetical protein
MSRFRSSVTYANVVSTLALFIALGGASYAAIKLPKDSVGNRHIKNDAIATDNIKDGAITRDKIRNGAIGSGKVRDGTLREDDFNEDELPEGEPGRDGLDGRDGFDGRDGPAGPPANPEYWAFANADGTGVRGTAVSVTKSAPPADPGTYVVNFAGDRRASCGFIASLDGAAPGFVAVGAGTTEAEDAIVRTYDNAGAAADRGFHLTARC